MGQFYVSAKGSCAEVIEPGEEGNVIAPCEIIVGRELDAVGVEGVVEAVPPQALKIYMED